MGDPLVKVTAGTVRARVATVKRARSEPAARALARRHVLETGRPPSGAQRLGELGGQPLGLDGARDRLVVVRDGDELHVDVRPRGEQRIPDPRRAVVFGTAYGADLHRVGPAP